MTDLSRLLAPRSIAIVGEHQRNALSANVQLGFRGRSGRSTRNGRLGGMPATSLEALPVCPTLSSSASIVMRRSRRWRRCVQWERAVVCYGAGFPESGEADLQRDPLDAAEDVPFGPTARWREDSISSWPDEHGCSGPNGCRHRPAERQCGRQYHVQQRFDWNHVSVGNQAVSAWRIASTRSSTTRITTIGRLEACGGRRNGRPPCPRER